MKFLLKTTVLALSVMVFAACKKKNNGDPVPVISFLSFTPETIRGGSSEDTAYLSFKFADGDADLGNDPSSGNYDVFLKDSRDSVETPYFFPEIPDEIKDPYTGLQGTCTLVLLGAFLLPRQDSLHLTTGDTLQYEVYIKDRAGHESNHFTTPPLYLVP